MADIFTNSPSIVDIEENDLTDFDATVTSDTGSIGASSTEKYEGSYSAYAEINEGDNDWAFGNKGLTWPGGGVGYVRSFVYINGLGSGSFQRALFIGAGFFLYGDSLSSTFFRGAVCIRCSTGEGFLCWADSGGFSYGSTSYTFSTGQWYELEIKYDDSGTDCALEWWVDNDSKGTETGSGKASSPVYMLGGVGARIGNSAHYGDVYVDYIQAEDARIGGAVAGQPFMPRTQGVPTGPGSRDRPGRWNIWQGWREDIKSGLLLPHTGLLVPA